MKKIIIKLIELLLLIGFGLILIKVMGAIIINSILDLANHATFK